MKYIIEYLKYDVARGRQTEVESPSFVVVSEVRNNNHAPGKSKDSCTEKKTVVNLVSFVYWREHMLKDFILWQCIPYIHKLAMFTLKMHLIQTCCFLFIVWMLLFIFLFRRRQAMLDSLNAIAQYGICQDYSYILSSQCA